MNENAYQAMPRTGRLAKNLNQRREALAERIAPFKKDTVYCYIVDTVEYSEGRLYQTGSGPNFQGDLITLCSCKHKMRTYQDIKSRTKGVWIAGFTNSRDRDSGSNRLHYLMMVSERFESHRELWFSDSIPEETKFAKAANLDRFGDIYQPQVESGDPYSYWNYFPPCDDHVHCEPGDWHTDIDYHDQHGHRPELLVGHPEYSFLWDKPVATAPFELSRGEKKKKLSELFPLD